MYHIPRRVIATRTSLVFANNWNKPNGWMDASPPAHKVRKLRTINQVDTRSTLYAALQNEVLNAVNQHALFFAAALPRTLFHAAV